MRLKRKSSDGSGCGRLTACPFCGADLVGRSPTQHLENCDEFYHAFDKEPPESANVERGVPVACECPSDEYRPVATDGGTLHAEDDCSEDDGDVEPAFDAEDRHRPENPRPDDCSCLASFDALPCWPCYRDGFNEPRHDVRD